MNNFYPILNACVLQFNFSIVLVVWGVPCGSAGKESACNAGDLGLMPGQEDPLENGMAAHSSIPAWRISWTEAPGSLSPWGHKETFTHS